MLEEWLLEGMQLGSKLRVGTWIAQILYFHPAPDVCTGGACISEGNAAGDSSDESNSTGLHSETRMKLSSQCQTTKSEEVQ